MVNRSKNIGTTAETAVVRAAQELGYLYAKRPAQKGALDAGDVIIHDQLIAQVKGGVMAGKASENQVEDWWGETLKQAANYSELYGHTPVRAILVVKRKGVSDKNAERWHAYFSQNMSRFLPLLRVTLREYLILEKQHPKQYLEMVRGELTT